MENPIVSLMPSIPRLAYSLAESETLSGLSRSTLYRAVKAGELKTVRRGRRQLVPAAELQRFCSVEREAFGERIVAEEHV